MDAAENIGSLAEIEGQSELEQKPTVGFKLCQACSFELRERDKFCRHCGTRQTGEIAPSNTATAGSVTARLQAQTCRSVSASLLTGIEAGAQASTARLNSRVARCLVSALIAVPLWLMIVLLAPFDAYATAKAIANQH